MTTTRALVFTIVLLPSLHQFAELLPSPRQLAAVCALMNVAGNDLKAAAAIRDADGLQPLVHFVQSDDPRLHVAAATALIGCALNETNKSLLRDLGAIEALLRLCSAGMHRDAHAAAVAGLANLMQNEDDSIVRLRLQGGLKKLQSLLYSGDLNIQGKTAETLFHCSPNADTRTAMRLADCLRPLVALLSSPSAAARLAAGGALMQATQTTRTNQVKCRELGAIAPLLRLLEPPEEGPPDIECQRRAVWCLSNIVCEAAAAKQLRQTPSGLRPLVALLDGGGKPPLPGLQRPAVACLFNSTANDSGAPDAIIGCGGIKPLVTALRYAEQGTEQETVASSAGVLLNCAVQPGFAATLLETEPDCISRLLTCLVPSGHVMQNSNACGALQNISADSAEAATAMLEQGAMGKLLEILATAADEPILSCHAGGAIANMLFSEEVRSGVRNGVDNTQQSAVSRSAGEWSAAVRVSGSRLCYYVDTVPEEEKARGEYWLVLWLVLGTRAVKCQ